MRQIHCEWIPPQLPRFPTRESQLAFISQNPTTTHQLHLPTHSVGFSERSDVMCSSPNIETDTSHPFLP